ncbi:MAG: hydrogenase maturation nickel metallochaperone HypA [Tepidimonas sp.]|uniref:hydrogenase maturation nickel metallochaperone HypA/HybF n=1 Tax=Tepidimonas sp. TaxID=2002775 RepID=UPI00298EE771|nr:hydrogenase maturation nickel metallochaperone HypA [Tepidimonas sp.]MCS6809975.1 hydrogenase maturation nickel metallochaperone HypA [Tepidimonas sp.]MDW8335433.1 hydrogenase maturation nickel metallochaperone HypA [Tepidimonas sp.]
MHEASLAGSVLRIVEQAAVREGFARVVRLRLAVGELASVEEAALRFALAAVMPGTVLDGAQVDIEIVPGRGRCGCCGHEGALPVLGLACSQCGAYAMRPTAGLDLRVVDLQVCDDAG